MPRKRESASAAAVSSKTRTRSAQKLTNNGRGDGEAAEALSKTPKRKSAPSTKSASSKRPKRKDLSLKRCDSASGEADLVKEEMDEAEEVFNTEVLSDEEENETSEPNADWKAPQFKAKLREKKEVEEDDEVRFMGKPVPEEEARKRWPHRYQAKKLKKFSITEESEEVVQARKHYTRAEVDKIAYNLYDDAHVWAGVDSDCHICKIIEMFEATDGTQYITSQWYYRARDTAIKHVAKEIDENRVFFSEIKDDNDLSCLVKKLSIARVPLNVDLKSKLNKIPACDYFCDMMYLLPFSSFVNLPENVDSGNETSSTISSDVDTGNECEIKSDHKDSGREKKAKLLDLYAGCGGMSTGLCSGARMAGLDLETGWAIDINSFACESLKWNHPETQVRNETAEDFLSLMKEWRKLCIYFSLVQPTSEEGQITFPFPPQEDEATDDNDNDDDKADDDNNDPEVFEVEEILDICYGDPNLTRKGRKLHFKVHWKNYGSEEDTWEPTEGLSDAPMIVKKFVANGFMAKIIPLPGDVDVVCGGPPCQGVSGFNRFRNKENPLADEKNMQLLVYMDIVDYLKPKYVLMENVVDLVKFADGFLGKYALARLIKMNYQTRLGLMAAGSYGLPQFRRRVFLWGARPEESLPQFPLPTHDVVRKGGKPNEFEMNLVLYEEGKQPELEKKLFLEDAISDLPPVGNFDNKDEMEYVKEPKTEFQRFIRSRKEVMRDSSSSHSTDAKLFDHRPYKMNQDDYDRVCEVPKKKGANFRDLPGVLVGPNNVVYWDPNMERVLLTSGKPLVPDYAMSFVKGRSSKPFGRLWWDETVPTVVTRPEPHNQKILHPTQDRVLTVRENARLQGFPDYYKLFGPIKERYIQVGNAVAVPVARALGYSLAMAYQGLSNAGNEPLFQLPAGFPNVLERNSPEPESSQGLD